MNETKARQIVLAARPHGRPKPSDFRLEETAIPTPSAGQILLRVAVSIARPLHARPDG